MVGEEKKVNFFLQFFASGLFWSFLNVGTLYSSVIPFLRNIKKKINHKISGDLSLGQ